MAVQTVGDPSLLAEARKELLKWGYFEVTTAREKADLFLELTPTAKANVWAGKGAKAAATLTDRSGAVLWSTVKGGDWSMAGYSLPKVARAILKDLRKFVKEREKVSEP